MKSNFNSRFLVAPMFFVFLTPGFQKGSEAISFEKVIENGITAQPADGSYIVLVIQQLSSQSFKYCGGVIYRPNKVLTAAHCLTPGQSSIWIRYETQTPNPSKYVYVLAARFLQHPGYSQGTSDIAIITLTRNVQDAAVRYATLQSQQLIPNSTVTIYGWFAGWDSGSEYPERKKKAELKVDDSWIFARTVKIIGCYDDGSISDGLPAISSDGRVAGIGAAKAGYCGGVNYYSKVSEFLSWINSN